MMEKEAPKRPTSRMLATARKFGLIIPSGISRAELFELIKSCVTRIEEEKERKARERHRIRSIYA